MKIGKKLLAWLLAAAFLLSLAPAGAVEFALTASAEDASFFYTLDYENGTATIVGLMFMDSNDLTIPATLDGYPVVGIANEAFSEETNLASVTLPDSLTSIGENAFSGCTSLTSIMFGNGVTCIGKGAFSHCSSLSSVTIPDSVTDIGEEAFRACINLASITVGDNVMHIGKSAFYNTEYYNTGSGLENGMLYIGNYLIESITPNISHCSIREGTRVIADLALGYHHSLTSVTLPDSVVSIGNCSFGYCESLTAINIPDSVTHIGQEAFEACNSLATVTFGDGVTVIGDSAFLGCTALTSVTIPGSVTHIGEIAFAECTFLSSVTVLDGVKTIGDSAFWNCTALSSILLPDSLTSIGKSVFSGTDYYNKKTNWQDDDADEDKYEDNVLYIGNHLIKIRDDFSGIDGAYRIRENTKTIADYACYNCRFTSVTIPDSVIGIGSQAFNMCHSLSSVNIPDGVTAIGDSTFAGCHLLTAVTIPNGVTSIGNCAFASCSSLTSVTIPASVTNIGEWAFSGCKSLSTITIPNSVTGLGNWAFDSCTSLVSVTLPVGVIEVGRGAFHRCSALMDVYYGGNEENRNSMIVWSENESLQNAEWHYNEGCSHVYDNACDADCNACGAVREPEHVFGDDTECDVCGYDQSHRFYTYEINWALGEAVITDVDTAISGEVMIPNALGGWLVTAIADNAFADCTNITAVTLPPHIATIGENAFHGCTALTDVYYNGSAADVAHMTIADSAFGDVTWHYTEDCSHVYDNDRDTDCNICGAVRVVNIGTVGDVDDSGKIDSTDARLVLQYAVKKIDASALNTTVADVDGSGKVDSTDARLILQYAVKKISTFPNA